MESSQKNSMLLSMERYAQLKNVLSNVEIPYAVIKGEPLSILCYNKKGVRNSQDIDILAERRYMSYFEQHLKTNGFTTFVDQGKNVSREIRVLCISQSHQIPPYNKRTPNQQISVDLNHDLFWGEYTGKRIDISDFLDHTIEMNIYGCVVKTLSPIKAMVQLVLHHYKDMNSIYRLAVNNCINYNMFKDVFFLWKNHKEEISLEKLYMLSQKYEIIPYVFYVLYFTNSIFKDRELQRYVDAFRTPEGELYLNYYGLTDKERKRWKVDFQTRLKTNNMYELIRDDLTESDIEKIERNKKIFG